MAAEVLLVFSTLPDLETARRISRQLVEERVIACANLIPQIESIYRWQEKVESSGETLAWFKTSAEHYATLEARLRELHPYELPEIIAVPLERGLPGYLQWVADNCAPLPPTR